MKKVLFTLLFLFVPIYLIEAQSVVENEELELQVYYDNVGSISNPKPKVPIRKPKVKQHDFKLLFDTPCDGCILQLANEKDEIEFSIIIPSDTNIVELPSYLSGKYRIEILRGRFVFWGSIFL